MLNKIKSWWESRKTNDLLFNANKYHIIMPFLLGAQIENRRFINYIFMIDSPENDVALKKRGFNNCTTYILRDLENSGLLDDQIYKTFGDSIMYNKEYNIIITKVQLADWELLKTCVNIAEKTTKDTMAQALIAVNSYTELSSK